MQSTNPYELPVADRSAETKEEANVPHWLANLQCKVSACQPVSLSRIVTLSCAILFLVACSMPFVATEQPTVEPVPPSVAEAPATAQPSATPEAPAAAPTPAATALPLGTLTAELSATVMASLPPTATPDPSGVPSFGSIAGANVLPLDLGPDQPPAWAAYTYGMRGFDLQQEHFVAIYTYGEAGWQEASRLVLETADYLDEQSVSIGWTEPGAVWIEVQSGIGAHGGCFDLLRFDGTALTSEVASCNANPFAGELRDFDGDEVPEVILNQTDYYVFCYACGVRVWQFQVLRWDGSQMVEVQLTPLGDSAPDDLRRLNNRAIELARAGLWKEARETIAQIANPADNPMVFWNAELIRLHAEARAEQVREGPYPLLDTLFYGDYPATLEIVRPYAVEEIFAEPSALVAGTVAEGWELALSDWMTNTTTLAIQARPDLAAAFFLRGLGLYLSDPGNPQVLADIERAAQLAPNEALFAQSVTYLRERQPAQNEAPADPTPLLEYEETAQPTAEIPPPEGEGEGGS